MEVAWTTILIIALLFPGVFFFIGYATSHRYTREIVKSSAIGEVGGAIFVAIIIHLLAWGVLSFFGFNLASNLKKAADYGDGVSRGEYIDQVVSLILPVSIYVLVTALIGLGAGRAVSFAVSRGLFPFLVTHKWINQVQRSMKTGLVTAYVMTNTIENNRVLMYKGILAEFYQQREGRFEYVVLKSCSRYFMTFDQASPKTGEQMQLFASQIGRPEGVWDFLQIEGANIANILFDPSPQIVETKEGAAALEKALIEILNEYAATADAKVTESKK